MANLQEEIMSCIPKGKSSAISQFALAGLFGITDRQLRRVIKAMRQSHYPIFTDPHGGYYQPSPGNAGISEAREFFRQMTHRGLSSLVSAGCAKEYIRKNTDQISLDDLVG